MAKLGAFYALCPLIDTKSFFGVHEDPESGIVIATLGKNIASRYKLSDQKQISCWRTKEKFSSPIVYDETLSKYVSVFNKSFIRMWDTDVNNLDKLKKYKFNKPIHTLISKHGQTYVVFQNGALYTLEEALEERKILNPSSPEVEQIEDILYEQINSDFYFGMIVKAKDTFLYWTKYESGKHKFHKIKLDRGDLTLNGYVFHTFGTSMNLLTLWSDGAIYSRPLDTALQHDNIGELFSIVESVSSKNAVSIASLDENYIALYGANYNEEGAILVIYNTQFRVTQSKQPFKLFTANAKVWRTATNLILPVGQNLAVVPFHLETEQLAALVGSHILWQDGLDSDVKVIQELEVGHWDDKLKVKAKNLPPSLKAKIEEMIQRGSPEAIILDELLPEIFAKHDIDTLTLCIKHFSDVSEKQLSKMLKYCLDVNASCFKGNNESTLDNLPAALQPPARTKLLDSILCKSFSEALLLPHLRSDLSIRDVSVLLQYIYLLWCDDKRALSRLSMVETDAKLMQWCGLLIDSNYQKIVLSNEESIKETLQSLNGLIEEHIRSLEDLKMLAPILYNIKRSKKFNSGGDAHVMSLRYSVEQLSLY